MKKILVTNDDGINTTGVAVLARAMAELGEVTVVAPDREMSAISHALTLAQPLRIAEVKENWHAITGTPTDCVYIGLVKIMGKDVDLVASGINNGANLGEDIHYSGTVAAAVEGRILGIPSISFSQIHGLSADLTEAAELATRLADSVLTHGLDQQTLLNVNFPPPPSKGVRLTRLGRRHYEQAVEEKIDPRGQRYYWVGGSEVYYEQEPDTDTQAVHEGYVSVTPLQLDLTDDNALRSLSRWKLFRK